MIQAKVEDSTTNVSFAFGSMTLVGAVLALLLPETLGRPLPNTMEEVLSWPFSLTKEERQNVRQRRGNLGYGVDEVKMEKRQDQPVAGIFPGGQFKQNEGQENPAYQ